ncbi:N-acetylmuramoyl-L-alanine amidase [Sporosarcina sp. BI001-red]|uniref:N-acetylmuramoyl-L-alanine amidase family protein n=1 Tax=Sporosarcina sp. BI001-red TaxID=2282866 RepID=UPI000E23D357|nr:N-acetylmuramoyl-L-alanine amidase [Sporosarcina sp. BI001-red]REB09583.1 N-acetylmuramoyl-L-alanine amidase [Sporosarcina sp. BI001-red]
MSKIFIDPGHGGHDSGAVGKRSKEKDNVLKVGLNLKALLESYGHTVKLSRSTDVFIALSERAQMANRWGADYFVSLHNNSATSDASGFETFIYNGNVSSSTTKLQAAIHNAISKEIGIRDRGMKRESLAVLRESSMPAVLIEYAFISNTVDETILINQVEKLAQLTAKGIVAQAGIVKPTAPTPGATQKEEPKLYKPSASAILNSTATVLKRLEQKVDNPLDPQWREKLLKGELTESDAIGLLYVAIDRGHIVGKAE